ncbi:MAG TPA: hypothetical protein VIT65_22275 [Microlunatus sp.]
MPPRGRKDSSLLVATKQGEPPTGVYISCGRPLKVGEYELPPGIEVPGAADWPRVEAWVNARRIRQVRVGEDYTPFETFKAGVDAERLEALEALIAEAEAEDAARTAAAQKQEQLQGAVGRE